jgi:EAL domain-containing protein (putative c-di-GMP-specific phosphodiesterase class I)
MVELSHALPEISGLQLSARGSGGGKSVVAKLHGAYLGSAFQAWRSPCDGEVLAYEAYARSHSKHGENLSPWQLFAEVEVDDQLVTLDRLCRTVHALNYFAVGDPGQPLVLNVDARLLHCVPDRHGEFFSRVLGLLDVAPQRIVIDIRTSQLIDLSRLRRVIGNYRRHGFQVAVNAEGVMHARSLANLLMPDVLMLEADVLHPKALANMKSALAKDGVRVAVKRIETSDQLAVARDAGVDWVQGFLLDLPTTG